MNKNELLKTYKKQERTFNKLKTKFTELTLAYREVDKENQKVKVCEPIGTFIFVI